MTRRLSLALAFVPALAFAAPARDGKIMKLAKKAASCKFEDGSFDSECPALDAWRDEETLFADGKGDTTVLSMFGDTDPKMRELAGMKGFSSGYLDDKAHALEIIKLASSADESTAATLTSYVSRIDPDKVGVSDEVMALAKSPTARVRSQLAGMISKNQGKTAVKLVTMMVDDADKGVRRDAISDLSTGGITPGVEPVCTLLSKQLSRNDDLAGDALWSGSSSKCVGMDKKVLAELEKRAATPAKVTNANGIGYTLALSRVCSVADDKTRGLAVAKTLSSAKVSDANTRAAAIGALRECGGKSAAPAIVELTKDKDDFVAKRAKEELGKLK